MKKLFALLVTAGVLAGALAGCGSTPEPTEPPPTQTPWIIVVTATPGPGDVAMQPTQTPWIIVATPTPTQKAPPTPTEQATTSPGETPASPTPTTEPTQTETAATAEPPSPTNTPRPVGLKYPPPVLLEPPNNRPVSWKSTVLLKWTAVGELGEDEYYHVHLERPPKTEAVDWWGDYVYTKETEFLVDRAFLAPFHYAAEHGHAVVYWWVRVVRQTGEDPDGKPVGVDIGGSSEKRTLILDPKPEGQ